MALVLDDEAAVALPALAGLASRLGLAIPPGMSEALAEWDIAGASLGTLVMALADDDIAIGHRGAVVPVELLTPALLLPGLRQIVRLRNKAAAECLPVTVQGAPGGTVRVTSAMGLARPNLCLGAVLGRGLYRATPAEALAAVAGWTLALELVGPDGHVSRAPGSLALGPYLVPAAFADLNAEAVLGLMGRSVLTTPLLRLAKGLADDLAALSQDMLLTPGDVVVSGPDAPEDRPQVNSLDVIETVAPGFGRLRVSLQ